MSPDRLEKSDGVKAPPAARAIDCGNFLGDFLAEKRSTIGRTAITIGAVVKIRRSTEKETKFGV
jgi:hypothetical protein